MSESRTKRDKSRAVTPAERDAASRRIRASLGPADAPSPAIPFDASGDFPNIDFAWSRAQEMYPQAAQEVSRFSAVPAIAALLNSRWTNVMADFGAGAEPNIRVNRDMESRPFSDILDVIAHELVHGRQAGRAGGYRQWAAQDSPAAASAEEAEAYAIAQPWDSGARAVLRRDIDLTPQGAAIKRAITPR